MTNNEMSLLHHAAFDSNIEAVNMMATLPYFSEIVNDDNNDVSNASIKGSRMGGHLCYGLLLRKI